MDIPSDELTQYIKTHESIRTTEKKKRSLQKLQHKRQILKETLEEKPNAFWMWTPEEGAFHSIYKAKDINDIKIIINCCNPSLRMGNYSLLGILTLTQITISEKKEIISQLLSQNYTATKADKKLDIPGTWERCKEKAIIQKISWFLCWYSYNDLFQKLPKEIIHTIVRDLFYTESLL